MFLRLSNIKRNAMPADNVDDDDVSVEAEVEGNLFVHQPPKVLDLEPLKKLMSNGGLAIVVLSDPHTETEEKEEKKDCVCDFGG
jgi:hypothetical protein